MNTKSAFNFKEIYLLESSFKRSSSLIFTDPTIKHNVKISVDHQLVDDTILNITVSLDFHAGKRNLREITAKMKMVGVFICSGDSPLTVEQFAKANGPAIMFPFLREHLASITSKAGIAPVLLPAVNFIKLSEENKIKKALPTK